MSVTLNAKGTTVPHFTIGKTGTTFYQGTSDPYPVYSPKNGDYWFDTSLNALHVWSSTQTNWVAPRLADLTFTSSTISTSGADLTLSTNGNNAKVTFAGDVGPGIITASAGQDLYIDPTLGGGSHLVLVANRWPATDGSSGQTLITNGSGILSWSNSSQSLSYSCESASSVTTSIANGVTIVSGMSLTPATGSYMATFNCNCTSTPTSVTSTAATDLTTLYNALMALTPTNTDHAAAFGSETLGPGVYTVAAAGSIAGTLTLDAGGNPNALFVFRIGAAFTTSASATIALINSANSANVFFVTEGAASTGASTVFKGTILVNQAAASTGAGTVLEGRLLSRLGAVSIASSTLTLPTDTSVITVGQVGSFSMFTAGGDVSSAGASSIAGNIGTNLGAVTGFGIATVTGTIYTPETMSAASSFAFYKNGTLITMSSRSRSTTSAIDVPMTLQAMITATTGDVVDVRSSVTLGSMNVSQRIFTLAAISL